MQWGSNLQHKDDPQAVGLDRHDGQIHCTMLFMSPNFIRIINYFFYLLLPRGKPLS